MNLDAESITIEETPPGRFPEWLFSHIVNQALDPRPISEGGYSKILVLYPNEENKEGDNGPIE